MAENFTNQSQTTLNGALNNSQTNVVVTSATGFPAANFRIIVDSELMLVTTVSSNTFTVTRAAESTTAATHSNGATVTHVLTAASLVQAITDRNWTQDVNESGTSFSNWIARSGSWDSDGTVIRHTSVAGAWQYADFNTLLGLGLPLIAEAEIRFPTTGQGTGSYVQSGLKIGTIGVIFRYSGTQAILHQDWTITDYQDVAFTIALDTWYKIRCVVSGSTVTTYVDGVLKATTRIGGPGANAGASNYFGLGGYNSLMHYRNIKLWTLSGNVPA